MATVTERLELLITAKATDAINGLKQVDQSVDGVGTKTSGLTGKFDAVNEKLKGLGLSGISTGALVAGGLAAATGAAVGLVSWVGAGIDKQLALADSVRGVMEVSGLSADQASRLVEVTGDYGVNIDTVERAFWRLSGTVENNREKIEQHGIKVKESKDGTIDLMGTVENIQQAYLNAGDATERNAILMDAFGKSGKDLIPILEETGSLAEALSQVPESRILSEKDIEEARNYQLAIDDLHDAFDAMQRNLAQIVIPALTQTATTISTITEAGLQIKEAVGATMFDTVKDSAIQAINPLSTVSDSIGKISDLFGGGKDSSDSYAEAQKRVADASKEVAELAADETTKHGDLREAKKELADAQADLEGKTKAVANALQDENSKTQESINLAYQRVGGILGVYGADLQYQQALNDHATKQAEVTRLEAEGKQGTLEYEGAKRALEEADLALVQSGLGLETQIQNLKTQVDEGKISTEEYQSRIQELKDKYPELGAALDTITGKVEDHTGAILDIPDYKNTTIDVTDNASWTLDQILNKIGRISAGGFTINVAGGARAEGGPVSAGAMYLVGERGPELFVPRMSGEIVPNHSLNSGASMTAVGGGNSYTISVQVAPGGNPADTGRAIVEQIRAYERRAGSSWRN